MAKEISRRTFINGLTAAGVVLAVGGCNWKGNNIPKGVQTGETTYDVLIIGSGRAGMRAAYFEDRAGHAMVHTLFEQCLKRDIEFISECQMLEISMDGDKLNGVVAMDMRSGNLIGVAAKSLIIATGGYGRVYWIRTSNPYSSTGDGITLGMNVVIPFKDPEMVQFHPTGLSANGVLLSESSRAEGAYLVNKNGERFMVRYAPEKKELATRDIVARAIARKESRGGHSRRDYPKRDDVNFLKHTLIFKDGENYRTEYKDVVITKYQPKERTY